jgi:hypothetical protein
VIKLEWSSLGVQVWVFKFVFSSLCFQVWVSTFGCPRLGVQVGCCEFLVFIFRWSKPPHHVKMNPLGEVAYYRCSFNILLWQRVEDKVSNPDELDILQVIKLTLPTWKHEVKPVTIANCLRHCRIRNIPDAQEEATAAENVATKEDLMDQEVIKDLESQVTQFRYRNQRALRTLPTIQMIRWSHICQITPMRLLKRTTVRSFLLFQLRRRRG